MLSCLSLTTFLALLLAFSSTTSSSQDIKNRITYSSIRVDPSGQGDFTTIQAAIDSVPSQNTRWTCIHIKRGVYREQVKIPKDKPYIYLKGEGKRVTSIVWDAHDSTDTSATFISQADYTIAKCITFVNSYNSPPPSSNGMRPALAAMIKGDKSAFYRCGFIGFQDTLWDVQGRHYFKHCTIQGAVDFIFGGGQSLYEGCTISVLAGALKGPGYITAQARTHDEETNGFVFKNCSIVGNGLTYLGRPWRDHARVLFYETSMSKIVVPQGWDAWESSGHEYELTFAEQDCSGLGSNNSSRVKWVKKLSEQELVQLTSFSFIDDEGWVSKLAFDLFAGK
ncbi:hypothetical protein CASFOL_021443 [Castilleja foliolosa]|uniref:Pectinesterase n=1 Tax=Castilleja foliolosa TaxID=1961234 RepID=A0ABD3CZ57_9LAMI